MEIEINVKKLSQSLNDVYIPSFTDYTNYYDIYYGGAGSGKSQFVARKLILKYLRTKRRGLVIRKVYASIQDSAYALLVAVLNKWKIAQHCIITKSPLYIRLPNGSEFLFKGLDDEEKIKSIDDISDVWIEETNELLKNDFDQLGLRMRGSGKNQQIFLTFNPISSEHWLHDRFFKQKDPRAKIIRTTYKDNRFLPMSYIEKLEELKTTNPRYYKIYALGEWGNAEGLIFTNWVVENNVRDLVNRFDFNRYGADWGWNDPTAIIGVAVNDNVLYIYSEYYKREKTKEEVMEDNEYIKKSGKLIVGDRAEPATIHSFQNNGFNIKEAIKPHNSVVEGINTIRNFSKVVIDSTCLNTIKEFNNYSNKIDKKTGKYIDEPIDDWNHAIDAIRYALEDYTYQQNRQNRKFGALSKIKAR